MKINTKDFLEKVKILQSVAEHTDKEIAVISFSDNVMIARGSSIYIDVDFDFEDSQSFSVSAKRLREILDKINTDEIILTLSESALNIKAGKHRSKLPLIQSDIIREERPKFENQLPADIYSALEICKISISKQKNFNWVFDNYGYISDDIISTDGQRCTVYKVDWPIDEDISLSKEVVNLILSLDTEYSRVSENFIEFEAGSYYIKTSKNQEEYPEIDYDIFKGDDSFKIKTKDFLRAIERVKIFSEKQEDNIVLINLEFNEDKLKIYSQNEHGLAEDKIKIKSSIRREIKINPDYLLDILRLIKDEKIVVKLSDKFVIFDQEQESFRHVITLANI